MAPLIDIFSSAIYRHFMSRVSIATHWRAFPAPGGIFMNVSSLVFSRAGVPKRYEIAIPVLLGFFSCSLRRRRKLNSLTRRTEAP
jgi:hypothetical protein